MLRRERYTLAVDFFGNPRSALLTAACGARHTAGYDLRGRRHAYGTRVARVVEAADGRPEYAAATHLRLAAAVGGREDGTDVRLSLSPQAQERASRALERTGVGDPGATLGLVPAGTWTTKTWPVSHFAALTVRLRAAGHRLLVICGPGEEAVAERLMGLAPGLAVLPPGDVATLAAVVARLRALIGTDSGPRHLAAAFGVPTYSWFGPGRPEIWTPDDPRHGVWFTDLPCRGCNRTACPHWNCLPGLSPDHAAERVLLHLGRHARPAADLDPAAGA
jgi:ADP-heptose:LPS heptosyltransferase